MFYLKYIILLLASGVFGAFRENMANSIPTAVALGGAIVAAVEDDEAQQRKDNEMKLLRDNETFSDLKELQNFIFNEKMDEGRGKKHKHKKDKLLKYLYPLLMGVLLAKAVIVPLILKGLTAISTSSFIMAKIALVASGLIVLRWLFADTGTERTRFEIVHVPTKNSGNNDWSDMSWSGSNYVDVKTTPKQRLKYIPLGSSTAGLQNAFMINKGNDGTDYRYGYDNSLEGKPFL